MDNLNIDLVRKYFLVAFKVKSQAETFGATNDLVYKLISQEFNVVSNKVIERYFNEMINSNFLFAGKTGIRASVFLENQYAEFQKKYGVV